MELGIFILGTIFIILLLSPLITRLYNKHVTEKMRKSEQAQIREIFENEPLSYNIFQSNEFKSLDDLVKNRIIEETLKRKRLYGRHILSKEAFLNEEIDLQGCFKWHMTSEGHDYWKNLHINVFKREFKK